MTDTGSNSVVVNTLPTGADMAPGSRNAGSALEAVRSLRPILQLMNIYFDGTEWHYEVDRNLEWDVILARTAEVEEIIIDNTEEAIPPAAYIQIPRSLAGAYLFPNLTRLHLVNKPLHSPLYHLPLFVSPRLHFLEVDSISKDDISWLDCFLRDPDLQVSLTNVILGPIQYSPQILWAISRCQSVEIVTLTFLSSKPLDGKAIHLLGTTPKLQSLTIKADHVPYTPTYDAVRPGFLVLRDIRIIGVYSFVEAIILTIATDGATIHTLDVTISSDWATESPFCPRIDPRYEWESASGTVATLPSRIHALLSNITRLWSSSLCDFTLGVDLGTQGIASSHPTLLPEDIGQLTELSGLRRLVVSGFNLEGLDDLLQAEIARPRWPNIEEIQFPIPLGQQTGVRTTISLSTFRHLVQRCANLVSFGGLITLPPTVDDLSEAFNKNPIQSGLKQLSTGSLEAIEGNHNMLRIARFLEKLCPDLDKLVNYPEYSPTTWSNIFEIVTAFKEVRQEGRAAVMRSLSAN